MNKYQKLLSATAATLFISACGSDNNNEAPTVIQPAKVITIDGVNGNLTREFPGTVQASQRVDLAFQVQGRLVARPVREGMPVEEGQLLAKLDDRDYKSAVSAAKAEAEKNGSNFKRATELVGKGFISQSEYDQIKANYDISVARLDQASKALEDSKIVAPFSGVIAKVYVENFQDVQAKQAIMSLQDKADLEIAVNVSETIVARRKDVNTINLAARFDSLPDHSFELFIKEFSTQADPTTQTFEYILGIKDKQGVNILPGMTANVKATADPKSIKVNLITIPLSAVAANPEGTASVWKVGPNNTVTSQNIETGELAGRDQVEVKSGLQNGDVIVTAGISFLSEGLTIKPIAEVQY